MSSDGTSASGSGYGTAVGYGEGGFGGVIDDSGGSSPAPPSSMSTLEIIGTGTAWTDYTLETDGTELTANADVGSVNPADTIEGLVAMGTVHGGTDAYDFDGVVSRFEWAGPDPTTRLNGVEVPPSDLTGTHPTMTKKATLTLTLEAQGELTITTVDGTGAPVEGATVALSGAVTAQQTTDATGEVTFGGLEVADYTVEATKDGHFPVTGAVTAADFADADATQ